MKAIEFATNIKNGIIKVPQKYLESLEDGSFRIIVLIDNPQKTNSRKSLNLKNKFKAVKIDTKGFKFDRNEANKR